jgi:hypothetical protein
MPNDASLEFAFMTETHWELFLRELDQNPDSESKLRFAFDFMEKLLSSEKADFKTFWEVRKKCLELFKEPVAPVQRAQLWQQFSQLSKEARRLKDLLYEQSDFTAEQIDMAIRALEEELEKSPDLICAAQDLVLPEHTPLLDQRYAFYNQLQKELTFLNLAASRIHSLRKELIKTEMRIRVKNQFFDRLSKGGNQVFPRRKELVHSISQAFQEDVDHFVHTYFSQGGSREPFFSLRQKIQALQSMAKLLTLNAQAFSSTRLKLSACWDQTKEKEKERKQELDKKKDLFKQNAQELLGMIEDAAKKWEASEMSDAGAMERLKQISFQARAKELGHSEVKEVKEALRALQERVKEKQKAQDAERHKQEEILKQQRKNLIAAYKEKVKELINQADGMTIEAICEQRQALLNEIQKAALNKNEKTELERSLNPLKDLIQSKKDQILMELPEDEKQALEQLKKLKCEREEIKIHIEQLRKTAGSSGFDFAQAMENDRRLKSEKENLEKVQTAIQKLEKKFESA